MLEYEGWWRGYILSQVISLTWKLDPADIGLPLSIVHAVWGKLSSVYIRIVYCMTTMCMYILKLIITHYNMYCIFIQWRGSHATTHLLAWLLCSHYI